MTSTSITNDDIFSSDTNRTLAAISLAGYDITKEPTDSDRENSITTLNRIFEETGLIGFQEYITQLGIIKVIIANNKVVVAEQYYSIFGSLLVITTGMSPDVCNVRSYTPDHTAYYSSNTFHDADETPAEFIKRYIII
jgi:hypothetical protein